MSFFRKNRGPKPLRRSIRPSFRPNVEGFEDRIVPAGHVSAVISGGNLILKGDAGDNQIKITGSTRGPIDIEAIDTTTVINNQPGMVTLLGFRGSIMVEMGDGHDVLQIASIGPNGQLRVDMGAGDDTLTLTTATMSSIIDLNLGTGNDILNLQSIGLQGPMRTDTGDGDDQIMMTSARMERQSLFISGGGVDSIGYVDSKFTGLPVVNGFQQTVGVNLPRALDDSASVARGGTTIVNVAANDTSNTVTAGFDRGSVVILSGPTNGSATVLPDGTISYTHNNTFTNTDSLRYTIKNDRFAVSNPATLRFTITGFTGPTVTLTAGATSPTRTTPIPFTATFSDDVTGFNASEITATNGTVSNLVQVNAKTYTFNVAPTGDGTVTVTVPAGVAQNVLNLSNSASSPVSVTFDATSPVITINPLKTNNTSPSITGTVNDSSATVRVTVNGQVYTATISGNTWTAAVTQTLPEGTYSTSATATDAAGNAATASNAAGLVVDVTKPTVTITSESPDPTNFEIRVTITFSEAVGSFTQASEVTVTNGTATDFNAELGGQIYTVKVVPTGPGAVTVGVAADVANDEAGNTNVAAPTFTINVNRPTITSSASSPTNNATIPITVTFDEEVFSFLNEDDTATIVVGNGTSGTFTTVDNKTFTGSVIATAPGLVTVDIPANTVLKTGPVRNVAATQFSIQFATIAPSVAITSSVTGPVSDPNIPITITFSQDVTGFDAGDVVVGNGTLSNFVAVDARTYTATVTATANGAVTVDVPANVATNAGTGGNAAAPQFSIAFSNSAPTLARTIANVNTTAGAANTSFTVAGTFADADIENASTATLNILNGNTAQAINLQFFDKDAPASVANFYNYADRYAANGGAVFHRMILEAGSIPPGEVEPVGVLKIIQAGGYAFSDIANDGTSHLPTDSGIQLEYSPTHENVRGTIAMARTAVQNSGTSEFFFNFDDANGSTLNGSNGGGYAVFGQVASAADLAILDDLEATQVISLSNDPNSPFQTFPYVGAGSPPLAPEDTIRIVSLVTTNRDNELTYTVSSSNAGVVAASVDGFAGNRVTLDYLAAGTSTITVTATDRAGHVISTTFTVTVT